MFLNLPHEVSGQYGKVERNTRNALFNESDLKYINIYYSSGLVWYKVDRYVRNNYDRKYFKARWHLMMLLRYLMSDVQNKIGINKENEKISRVIETLANNDNLFNQKIEETIEILNNFLIDNFKDVNVIYNDRKLFERKETTDNLLKYLSRE